MSKIRLIKPYIEYVDVEEDFKKIFESGWFTKGEYIEIFKQKLKEYTGAKYVFPATSATTALSVALKCLGVDEGDEVIVSDFSFPATANVVEDLKAIPVFADVNLSTFNMLPAELEAKITKKTKAVIFVDALGNPSGITAIKEICAKHKLPLIEDAACALGSSEYGVKCGNIADITCFSFHPRKLLTAGEGGAITTNNDEYAKWFDIKLNHGATVTNGKFDFVDYGYNYRLPELQAVMLLKQIPKLDEITKSRLITRSQYLSLLEPLSFKVQEIKNNVLHNVQSLVFVVPETIDRNKLIHFLAVNEVESTIGTYCLSATTFYRNKYQNIQTNASFLEEKTITLPCYEGVDVGCVCKVISNF